MAPLLSEEEAALDPYALLGIPSTSTEKEIERAYRKKSLRCHPDKNKSPEAKIEFEALGLSKDLLLNAAKRNYIDTKLEGDRLKKAKYAELDKKRKDMVDALTAREEDHKKRKVEAVKQRQQAALEETIKEDGRKMLAEKQRLANLANIPPPPPPPKSDISSTIPPITPADVTLSLQFSPSSTIAESSTQALQDLLTSKYGPISALLLKDPPKKKKGKKATVQFTSANWGGCWACWKDHQASGTNGLDVGVQAKWVTGEEPKWVQWASKHSNVNTKVETGGKTFDSADVGGGITMEQLLASNGRPVERQIAPDRSSEFESMTLFKMRQLERERLEEQIRREEDEEE
ncbi:hypothetical protein P7C73_g1258, partial [Tremellales sp. Uapishka_1]